MKRIKTFFIIGIVAFVISVVILVSQLFQNIFLTFVSFLKAADGTPFDDYLSLFVYILEFAVPQAVFFFSFFKIKKSTEVIIYDDAESQKKLRYYKILKTLCALSVSHIILYLLSLLPILIWGFHLYF